MDPLSCILPEQASAVPADRIGGKAHVLARLQNMGYTVPPAFFITTAAYSRFIRTNRIDQRIAFELGRKPLADMRWEELWDAALRIRSYFSRGILPEPLLNDLRRYYHHLGGGNVLLAVRSSAPGEDGGSYSFAGLHESRINIAGFRDFIDAVRDVWASLWSDGALLYQKEMGLDPHSSTMGIVVQEMIEAPVSGVAFSTDPTGAHQNRAIIEAVDGLCANLVDGTRQPQRWDVSTADATIQQFTPDDEAPLLTDSQVTNLMEVIRNIETEFGFSVDMEWTGTGDGLTLLQVRPITTRTPQDGRSWYLSLSPGRKRLKELAERVSQELIPRLAREGQDLAALDLSALSNAELADEIDRRTDLLASWRDIYKSDFIPFAHGVRTFGRYYNDTMHPEDPFEFVQLLHGKDMISAKRNTAMTGLARRLAHNPSLKERLKRLLRDQNLTMETICRTARESTAGEVFAHEIEEFSRTYLSITYDTTRLNSRPDILLHTLLELSQKTDVTVEETTPAGNDSRMKTLEERFLAAVAPDEQQEAREILKTGRLSWQLRDDDNILLGQIEAQHLHALSAAAQRLQEYITPQSYELHEEHAALLSDALRSPRSLHIPAPKVEPRLPQQGRATPRQLVGQPASVGIVSGQVRIISTVEDLGLFKSGEILVCDAIQPNMTHIVPLAAAVVERRGGMLIHGAIIARELGIPCVSGIPDAAKLLHTGDTVTVDGNLGIVTVGGTDFDLELT
ncbi:MAG: PEP/pyruvate-binding domain-containing protein [Fibrobacterota bacterium]